MAEKNINARVQHKHDVEANWLKASSFVPKQGEIIVYDVDSTHTYERIKIGDGTTVVGSLPFVNDEIRQALTSGTTKVSKAETADRATTADSATKATQDGNGQVIADTYETKADAANKLSELQTTLDTMNENLQNNVIIDLEGSNEGEANGINADTLGGNVPSYYATASQVANCATISQMTKAAPRNLLDNSDFTNPVNQRGLTNYTDIDYTIDRWRTWSEGETVTVNNGYISKTGNLAQYVSGLDPNKTYTAAVCLNDGTIYVSSNILSSGLGSWSSLFYVQYTASSGLANFRLTSHAADVKWAALYEGEYTPETLPEYQPKGYGAELAECQRYYLSCIDGDNSYLYLFMAIATGQTYGVIPTPVRMRVNPTVTWENLAFRKGATDVTAVTEVGSPIARDNGIVITVKTASGTLTTGTVYQLRSNSGKLIFSADL